MRIHNLVYVIAAVAALAAASQITFALPGTPVPQTGQTLAVLFIGALAGPLRGRHVHGVASGGNSPG